MVEGAVHVIPDETGQTLQSSIVAFLGDGSVVVGNQGRAEVMVDPINTVYSAKRLIGRAFESHQVQDAMRVLPYEVVRGNEQQPFIEIRGETYAIPEVSGMVLRRMKDLAEKYLGCAVHKALVTVPANFNDTQRQMTILAGELAGLKVLRVINEPTAAALAYGYGHDVHARIAIYDFGGGTFDVTILDVRGHVFEVLSTAGDSYLGGDDIDERLIRSMILAFEQQNGMSLNNQPAAVARLKHVAEKTKIELSQTDRAVVSVTDLASGPNGENLGLKFQLDRASFDQRCEDIIQRTFLVCDEALRNARMTASDLDQVILVGGSTRLPLVRTMVGQYFGSAPLHDVNPDEVVAVGAAIQGSALAEDHFVENQPQEAALLLDVIPQSLGIESAGAYFELLIEKNTQVPCEGRRMFTTSHDGQTEVRIRVYQGQGKTTSENVLLGEVELFGLRPAPRGEVNIDVAFEIDANGIMLVRAQDRDTGLEQATRIQVSAGYTPEEIQRMKARAAR